VPKPQDLSLHECLVQTSGARVFDSRTLQRDGEVTVAQVPGKIRINDGMALVAAACAGGGILAIDQLLVDEEHGQRCVGARSDRIRLAPGSTDLRRLSRAGLAGIQDRNVHRPPPGHAAGLGQVAGSSQESFKAKTDSPGDET
jgi:hypothetical protein